MSETRRKAKSYTMELNTLRYVSATRGARSASERVNELLCRAIREEEYEQLDREAAEFFAHSSGRERKEARALQMATRRSLARD